MKRTSIALLFLSILGAISGYLRELSMAITYGAGRLTDAYFIAISIPMVIGDLIIGSVLTACIVPIFSKLRIHDDQECTANSLLSAAVIVVGFFGVLIALGISLILPNLIGLLAPGFDKEIQAMIAHYAYWLIWLLPINGILLMANLVLNAYGAFIQPAITWLAANLIFFLVVIFGNGIFEMDALIWAAMLGPVLMLLVNAWRLHKEGLLSLVKPAFGSDAFRKATILSRPVLLTLGVGSGLGLLMMSHVVLRTYGSNLGDGAVSALSYAFRIYEVPISLMMSTAGVLVLPAFSTLFHQQDREKQIQLSRNLLAWAGIILLPMAILVYAMAEPLIQILFQGGAFKANDVLLTTQALQGFAPAIIFETIFMILFRIFYGMQQPNITVGVGVVTLAVLCGILELNMGAHSVEGLSASLSISFAIAALLSVCGLIYRLGWTILPTRNEVLIPLCISALGASWFIFIRPNLVMAIWSAIGFMAIYVAVLWVLLPDRASSLKAILNKGLRRPAR